MLLTVLYGFINQYAVVRVAESQDASIPSASVHGLPGTLAQCAAIFIATVIARSLQRRFDPDFRRRSIYILSLILADVIFTLLRLLLVRQAADQAGLIALRDLLALFIVTSIFGVAGERLARQVQRTQEALRLVEGQREQLLIADESARREVARYLHDNVQADLVVLAMQLRSQAATMSAIEGARLTSVIDELDKVRLLDIRTASRRLNPDIESLGLSAALRELALGYSPAMSVTIACPFELSDATPEHLLAIYRITEQALLNAASHGRARQCRIEVRQEVDSALWLQVTNDGVSLAADAESGAGTAIIEAWVSHLHGQWSLADEGSLTSLAVHFNVAE